MSEDKEAILFGLLYIRGSEGLSIEESAEVLSVSEEEAASLLNSCQQLAGTQIPGLTVKRMENTYQLVTEESIAPFIHKLVQPSSHGRLSQAALETLAIIAYNQPLGRVEIEDIRGVKSDKALQTLINKGLITEAGRASSIGRPILYKTTERFLEHFQLSSIDQLPDLEEYSSSEEIDEKAELFFESLNEQM